MKKLFVVLVIIFLLCPGVSVSLESGDPALLGAPSKSVKDGVILGIIQGNDYLKLSENRKTTWIIGVMDGIMAESLEHSRLFISKNKRTGIEEAEIEGVWLGNCLYVYHVSQIQAIFEKELLKNPEAWSAPAALIFRQRFDKYCSDKK